MRIRIDVKKVTVTEAFLFIYVCRDKKIKELLEVLKKKKRTIIKAIVAFHMLHLFTK